MSKQKKRSTTTVWMPPSIPLMAGMMILSLPWLSMCINGVSLYPVHIGLSVVVTIWGFAHYLQKSSHYQSHSKTKQSINAVSIKQLLSIFQPFLPIGLFCVWLIMLNLLRGNGFHALLLTGSTLAGLGWGVAAFMLAIHRPHGPSTPFSLILMILFISGLLLWWPYLQSYYLIPAESCTFIRIGPHTLLENHVHLYLWALVLLIPPLGGLLLNTQQRYALGWAEGMLLIVFVIIFIHSIWISPWVAVLVWTLGLLMMWWQFYKRLPQSRATIHYDWLFKVGGVGLFAVTILMTVFFTPFVEKLGFQPHWGLEAHLKTQEVTQPEKNAPLLLSVQLANHGWKTLSAPRSMPHAPQLIAGVKPSNQMALIDQTLTIQSSDDTQKSKSNALKESANKKRSHNPNKGVWLALEAISQGGISHNTPHLLGQVPLPQSIDKDESIQLLLSLNPSSWLQKGYAQFRLFLLTEDNRQWSIPLSGKNGFRLPEPASTEKGACCQENDLSTPAHGIRMALRQQQPALVASPQSAIPVARYANEDFFKGVLNTLFLNPLTGSNHVHLKQQMGFSTQPFFYQIFRLYGLIGLLALYWVMVEFIRKELLPLLQTETSSFAIALIPLSGALLILMGFLSAAAASYHGSTWVFILIGFTAGMRYAACGERQSSLGWLVHLIATAIAIAKSIRMPRVFGNKRRRKKYRRRY